MPEVLYARISEANYQWITAMAARSGLSVAKFTDIVIDEARKHEWSVKGPELTREDKS